MPDANLPKCRYCEETMMRWSWWDHPEEDIEFWLCGSCNADPDRQHLAIQVRPRRVKREGGL